MAPLLGLLQLVSLAIGCFAIGIALLIALSYPRVRSRLAMLPPTQRARILRWICAAPLAGAGVLTVLCMLPSLLGFAWPELDHCLAHDGHVHLCLFHPPSSIGGPLGLGVGGVFWGLIAIGVICTARRAWAAACVLRELRQAAHFDPAIGAHLIASPLPFCAVVGLRHQKIVVSTALVEALPASLLRAALTHEMSHVQRRDSFWHLVTALLSVAHLPHLRRRLLADLALASERACDEYAAGVLGDRVEVARAILFVERMLTVRIPVHGLAPAFSGSDVATRVEALLQPPPDASVWGLRTVALSLMAVALALTPSATLHHWTETVLGLLVR